jgi:hypothetical protein
MSAAAKRSADGTEKEGTGRKRARSSNRNELTVQWPRHSVIQGKYPVPTLLSTADHKEILTACASALASCSKTTQVDSATSLYPFACEILKPLVKLTGHKILLSPKSTADVPPDVIQNFAVDFLRQCEDMRQESEVTLLTDFQHYFKEQIGEGTCYVDICVGTQDQQVGLLVQCNQILQKKRVGPLENLEGYWQAAAAGVAAQEDNARVRGKRAFAEAYSSKLREMVDLAQLGTVQQVEAEAAALIAADTAREDAEANAREVPVYVALTDIRNWLFMKVVRGQIYVSKLVRMFDFCADEDTFLTSSPGMVDGLQYLCEALGVGASGTGASIAEALAAARRDNEQSVRTLLDSVFRPAESTRLCDAVAYTMGRLDAAQELEQWDGDLDNALPILERVLSKKYPDVVAAQVLKALQELRDKKA